MKLSEILKEKTEDSHQQLEKTLILRLKSIVTLTDYQLIISSFYGYIQPVESLIDKNIDHALLPDYGQRRKSKALLDDLSCLNFDSIYSFSTDLPEINNTYQAFGALYVLEGSTLGGQIISKLISQKLSLTNNSALSFFTSYGEETFPMWAKFKTALDSIPTEVEDQVVEAAQQTFIKFRNWLV